VNDLALVRLLEKRQSAVLSTQQAAAALGLTVPGARVRLSKMVARGTLFRVMRGRYALPSEDPLAVASSLYFPSYVSLMAAVAHHGTTTQSPRILDVVNPVHSGRTGLSLEAGSYQIRFIRVPPSYLYGFSKVPIGHSFALIAEKERAVIDGLLFPRYAPLDETVECLRSGIDVPLLVHYARRTGRKAVWKRLGHLLSQASLEVSPRVFGKLSRTFVPLDPALPRRGRYDSTWRVLVNTEIS
jgi:predicted transcriptional regulator of viral defense system